MESFAFKFFLICFFSVREMHYSIIFFGWPNGLNTIGMVDLPISTSTLGG